MQFIISIQQKRQTRIVTLYFREEISDSKTATCFISPSVEQRKKERNERSIVVRFMMPVSCDGLRTDHSLLPPRRRLQLR